MHPLRFRGGKLFGVLVGVPLAENSLENRDQLRVGFGHHQALASVLSRRIRDYQAFSPQGAASLFVLISLGADLLL